jgi:hypothetical protein
VEQFGDGVVVEWLSRNRLDRLSSGALTEK